MSLKNTIIAATLAIALPFAASAATLTINGVSQSFTNPADLGNVGIDVLETADVNISFLDDDNGGKLVFELFNVGTSAAAFTVVGGTIDQGTNYGFMDGVNIWLSNPDAISIPLSGESFDFNTVIAAGSSALFEFEYGDPVGVGNIGPDIDFTVFAQPVPIPAAGFLLLGGLGGLALTRRKKSA